MTKQLTISFLLAVNEINQEYLINDKFENGSPNYIQSRMKSGEVSSAIPCYF